MANVVAQINAFIGKGHPLSGHGAGLVAAANKYGVNPRVLAVIAKKESSFGSTSGRFKNNAFGWGVHLTPDVYTSPTWEAGAEKVAKGLSSSLYKGAGLKTVSQIVNRYAPPSENNTALYKQQVNDWYKQLGGDPNASVFGAPGAPSAPGAPVASPSSAPQPTVIAHRPTVDGAKLMSLLNTTSAAALKGIMPGAAYQQQLGKIAQNARLAPTPQQVTAAVGAAGLVGKPSDPSKDQVINAAKGQLGTPYVYGAGGPGGPTTAIGHGTRPLTGFDCSSLVQYAWAKVGVKLPRTTYDQIHAGVAVNGLKNAKPGDLLFPSNHHVQLYLGNGKVIEAPQTGGHVQIVPVRSSYIAIRRPR